MKITEMIKLLEELKEKHGEQPVFSTDDLGFFEPVICVEFRSTEEIENEGIYLWS